MQAIPRKKQTCKKQNIPYIFNLSIFFILRDQVLPVDSCSTVEKTLDQATTLQVQFLALLVSRWLTLSKFLSPFVPQLPQL